MWYNAGMNKFLLYVSVAVQPSRVWDQLHMTSDTLERLSDRSAYPDARLIAPGLFSPQRRIADAGRDYLRDIAPESFDAGHVVLNVAPGGKSYTVAYVTADDESMTVRGAYGFMQGK